MTSGVTYLVLTLGLLVSLQGHVSGAGQEEVSRGDGSAGMEQLEKPLATVLTLADLNIQIQALSSSTKLQGLMIRQLTNQLSELADEQRDLARQMPKISNENSHMTSMMAQLTDKNSNILNMMWKLTNEKEDMTSMMSKLMDWNKDMTNMVSEMKEDDIRLMGQMSKLTDDNKDLALVTSQLTDNVKELTNMVSEIADENEDMADMMSELSAVNENVEEKVSKIADNNDHTKTMMSELAANNKEMSRTISKVTENLQTDKKEISTQLHTIANFMTTANKEMTSSMLNQTKELTEYISSQAKVITGQGRVMSNLVTKKTNEIIDHSNYTINRILSQLTKENIYLKTQMANLSSMVEDVNKNSEEIGFEETVAPGGCSGVNSSDSRPIITLDTGIEVVCDTETDSGGWIVFQRRVSAEVDFYRNWKDYKDGFGELSGNFWLGLENIHQLTSKQLYELRIDITYKGTKYFAHYDMFSILGEADNYRLQVSGYSGNAGDSLRYHNGKKFTTKDNQNDGRGKSENCAVAYHGAWWYSAGCGRTNLNGGWGKGVLWYHTTTFRGTAAFTEMKMRRR